MILFKLKIEAYLAGYPFSFNHVLQDISMKLSSKSIIRKFVHLAVGVYYYLKLRLTIHQLFMRITYDIL